MYCFIRLLCLAGLLFSIIPSVRAETCPKSPLTRLQVESTGQVIPGLRGLRLRALPAIGAGTVLNVNGGTTFTVISGPSCNSGYNWWRVELTNGTRGWLAEGTWQQYYLMPTENLNPAYEIRAPWLYALIERITTLWMK